MARGWPRADLVHPTAIGRDRELEAVARFLQSIPEAPVAMLVTGEPGIGKTTIWKEGLARSGETARWVLCARPVGQEADLPFTALGDLLDRVLDLSLPAIPPPQAAALEAALLRTDPLGRPVDPRAVSLAALGIVRALAASGPVLIAIDDLQLLDAPSRRVLEFIVRRLDSEPVGVLAAIRSGQQDMDPLGLEANLPPDRFRRLQLGPLGVEDLNRLVSEALANALPRPMLQSLHRVSGGNPFYALELARSWIRQGIRVVPRDALPVPESLRDLVRERVAAIPPETHEALLVVSALSHPTVRVVGAALGSVERATLSLRTAVASGVLEADGDRLRFTHPLFSSIVYSDASVEVHRRVHRRLGEVVDDPEQRAKHLALAAEGPDAEVAQALQEASRRAFVRGAPDVAAELSELASRLTPSSDQPDARRRRGDAAQYHFLAGDLDRARNLLEELVAASTPGAQRGELLRRLAAIQWLQTGADDAIDLLARALREAEHDVGLRAGVARDIAWVTILAGDCLAAERYADTAVRLGERLEDVELLAEALTAQGFIHAVLGKADALATIERAVALVGWSDSVRIFRHPKLMHAVVLRWMDDYEGARSRFEAVRRRCVERGDESSLPFLLMQMSELESVVGNWRLAKEHAEQSCLYAREGAQVQILAAALFALALTDALAGRLEEARRTATEGLELSERSGAGIRAMQNLRVLGFVELSAGNAREAAEHFDRVDELFRASGIVEPGAIRYAVDAVEAFVAAGDLDRAEELLGRHEAASRAGGHAWGLAAGDRSRALLLAARGDLAGAAGAAERSVRQLRLLGQPFELGRGLLVLGSVLRRTKRIRESRAALEEARAVFEKLGSPAWAEKARAEAARLSGRGTGQQGSLTPSEWRVADLVAAGRTNREIAQELFISQKTVEVNLTRIFTKMGVRSRTELAILVSRRRGEA